MHHGNGPQNTQPQRSRSFTSNEGEEQQPQANLPQSPAASFAPSASPSGPQSPSYQIQQLIMSRNPVAGQNVNITLQNVGQVVAGNQQITLTSLPIPNPASPGFQFGAQQRRFEHGSPSYIQVTSPLPQQIQTPNSTQPSPVPVQTLQSVRSGTSTTGLGMCSQSPTRGFVDASVLVRQINLSPSNGGHFVFQDGSGITQIAQGTQVQIQTGTSSTVQERRLSQPHSQTGGTIHHLGPQSPVASGTNMQPLTSPNRITTTNLPPQISSIIQGQLIQQQQGLQGQQLSRPMGFDRAAAGMVATVGGTSGFGLTSAPTPTSPSRATGPHGLSNLPLTPTGTTVKKQPKKLEEIPPASQEDAQLRKQCLEHYHKHMKILKETFKEYLVELFFLQHFQGNMMDFLAFKKKHCVLLQAFVRQHFLDLEEEEEEEEDEEQSEVINDEPVHIGTANVIEIEALKRPAATPAGSDPAKRPRLDVSRHGMVFQHSGVASGVSLQQLMPTVQGGMPPTPQTVQLTGQKQSQQQYDPSKGPPVQNAASLHTPPPQLPGRLQPTSVPITAHPATLQLTQQQQQMVESSAQPQLQMHVKSQQQSLPVPSSPQTQLAMPLQQPQQPALHAQVQGKVQVHRPQMQTSAQQQNVALRPLADSGKPSQRPTSNPQSTSAVNPSGSTPPSSQPSPMKRTSPATSKSLSPVSSKSAAGVAAPKAQSPVPSATVVPQECSQNKLTEQETQVYQRIAELRKEGLWSLRRLPKLQEASRPKSHWDYLMEEMQWMAADFAQERRWKIACAKKLSRAASHHCKEKQMSEETIKKEEWSKLRNIAASAAREIEYFWSNIEQVVEIKLQVELQERRKKVLRLQSMSKGGKDTRAKETIKSENNEDSPSSGKKCASSSSVPDEEVDDEEETINEQETREGSIDHQAELLELAKEADLPLDELKKQYEGAYSENFHWPQPISDSEGEPSDQETDYSAENAPKQVVLIDSLLCIDQHRDIEKANTGEGAAKKHTRDIAEVAAAAELLLPRGNARITAAVKQGFHCAFSLFTTIAYSDTAQTWQ